MPVHLYGHPARMDEIVRIAEAHDLAVVEDGAPAFGAECGGVKAGTFGDVAAFSFQGAKLAVAGEGGILITDDDDLYARIYALWDQGRDPAARSGSTGPAGNTRWRTCRRRWPWRRSSASRS